MAVVYRLKTPTLGILRAEDDHPEPVTLPLHAVITVSDELALAADDNIQNGSHLIEVQWEDKKVLVFPQDLRERGENVPTSPEH
jgi:hypothetical protein